MGLVTRPIAVLLAAGAGSRFAGHTHKLLAPLRGRPVFEWAVAHALEADHEVWLVTGRAELTPPPAVHVLANPRWADGMATSLRRAVAHARARRVDSITVGLADQPFVPASAWAAVSASSSPIAVPTYEGVRGNPVRLHCAVWDLLPAEGDQGARSLVRERPDLVDEVPCDGSSADIDTWEDLSQWSS